jgi:hypothetical protein
VAEGARLESVYTGNRIVGSNPTPSANGPFAFSRGPPTNLSQTDRRKKEPLRSDSPGASLLTPHSRKGHVSMQLPSDQGRECLILR